MAHDLMKPKLKAILVGIHYPNISTEDHESSLAELGRLAQTLGYEVLTTFSQKRKLSAIGTVLGEGKLKELAKWTGGTGIVESSAPKKKDAVEDILEEDDSESADTAEISEKADIVIFDEDLSPTQLRNIESATGVKVLDRSGVIIEIFHRHAKTREACIQVEIAQLRYLAPRLRVSRMGEDRGGGGSGAGAKGVGETSHELDKRRIRDRIAELTQELETIHKSQVERRSRRRDQLKIALVGYTNAGKSSLMRALTATDVLVEDKLFATLDTTVRALQPETCPRILVSDTVGFIKKLPHDLVASFRTTLDEAGDASLLLYVVDASDPTFRSQLETTREVLKELDLDTSASLLILNKSDRLDLSLLSALLEEFPLAVALSAKNSQDVANLRDLIIRHFEKDMIEEEILIPYEHGKLLGEIHSSMKVVSETHDEFGTILKVRAFPELLASIRKKIAGL